VQITKHGRESVYLVSAETFKALWSSYRRATAVRDLSEDEMAMSRGAEIPEAHAYEIEDLEREASPRGTETLPGSRS